MKIHPVVAPRYWNMSIFHIRSPDRQAHHEKMGWKRLSTPAWREKEYRLAPASSPPSIALDALASDRQYRRALPIDQAMMVVQR